MTRYILYSVQIDGLHTGAEKAQTTRSENILRDVNRLTTNKEHFGVMASENNGIYQKGKFQILLGNNYLVQLNI